MGQASVERGDKASGCVTKPRRTLRTLLRNLDAWSRGSKWRNRPRRSGSPDGDGLSDGREDPDRDRLRNIVEFLAKNHPRLADTDGDGVPDASEDVDLDGVDNLDELRFRLRIDVSDSDGDGVEDGDEDADRDDVDNEDENEYGGEDDGEDDDEDDDD